MVILTHFHLKILHKQRLEIIKHTFSFIRLQAQCMLSSLIRRPSLHIFENESIETRKDCKKHTSFDVTEFALVFPTFRLIQQSLSRTRC